MDAFLYHLSKIIDLKIARLRAWLLMHNKSFMNNAHDLCIEYGIMPNYLRAAILDWYEFLTPPATFAICEDDNNKANWYMKLDTVFRKYGIVD